MKTFELNTDKIKSLATKSDRISSEIKEEIANAPSFYLAWNEEAGNFMVCDEGGPLCTIPQIAPNFELDDEPGMDDFIMDNIPRQASLDKIQKALEDTEESDDDLPTDPIMRATVIYNRLAKSDAPDVVTDAYRDELIERACKK